MQLHEGNGTGTECTLGQGSKYYLFQTEYILSTFLYLLIPRNDYFSYRKLKTELITKYFKVFPLFMSKLFHIPYAISIDQQQEQKKTCQVQHHH